MATHEDIHKDLYERLNATDTKMSEVLGQMSCLVQQNDELIKLLTAALRYMFWIIVMLICTVIYGAIGEKGFNAVRQSAPATAVTRVDVIPWSDRSSWRTVFQC